MTGSTRNRKGSQLSFELPSELLERLRAYAQSERRTVAALLRGWIEAGLAQQSSGLDIHSKHNDLSDLVVSLCERIDRLETAHDDLADKHSKLAQPIQDAGSAVLQVLQEASDRGVSSISRGELVAEITRRFRFAPKTIDNTLTRMVGARKPDICRVSRPRGHYKLSPRFLALSPNRIPPNGNELGAVRDRSTANEG